MLPMNYPLSNHDRRRTKPMKYMIVGSLTELLEKMFHLTKTSHNNIMSLTLFKR